MSLTCHVAWAVFTHPGFSHPICKGAVGAQPLGSLALPPLEDTLVELLPAADPPCPTEAPSGLEGPSAQLIPTPWNKALPLGGQNHLPRSLLERKVLSHLARGHAE